LKLTNAMLKKLSILLLTIFMVVPAMAQPEESCGCMFAPKAGQWQIDLALGQGQFFNDYSGLFYLLPNADGTSTGIGGTSYISSDLSTTVLNIGSLNYNSLTNIAGIQGKYFISNRFDINLMGAYNVNMQPDKDFIEGESFGLSGVVNPSENEVTVGVGDIYAQKAILGAVTNSLMVQIGSNYYFKVKNPRINPYLGVFGQFKMARIEAYYPYTGETVESDTGDNLDEDIAIYRASGRAGQVLGFGGGITMGVGYSLAPGLILGFEVAPVAYQYSLMHLQVQGQNAYYAMNHNLRAFTYPQLKIGIRF
ncbi:MAG: BT1926 family outer membrane beta-barrel protein, partial [Bacteroidales bacterium]